jgi:hypothetical protein
MGVLLESTETEILRQSGICQIARRLSSPLIFPPPFRGEKIPAAGRAVAHRLGVGDLAPPEVDGPRLASDVTEPLTRRAGLLGPQQRGLAPQEIGDGAAGDGAGRGDGHLLDVVGVEIELGPDLLVDAAGHDFPPPLGELLDPGPIHRW